MAVVHRIYKIDTLYQDRSKGPNEFIKWLKIKNAGGMRTVYKKKRPPGTDARGLAALVLVSRNISGARYNPWEDIVDLARGRIWYWGDAKAHASKKRDDFMGNKLLAQIATLSGEQRWSEIPPMLHFSKDTAGTVRFNGLCVLNELEDAWFEDKGKRVRNYRAVLDILPEGEASVAWLESRRVGIEVGAPPSWALYASKGVRQRLNIRAAHIRKREEQVPPAKSPEYRVLQHVHKLPPAAFERLVVRAFQESKVGHRVEGTRLSKDGGFDFHGSFELPPPLDYEVPIKGEAKRYAPGGSGVGPRDVARLVARLQRGEHGVFVTTSYFTQQCQDEVFADRYPVELVSGDRLVGMLQHLGAVRAGKLAAGWT